MITFKTFMETGTGAYGEYVNDVAEKTMVNTIINLLLGGIKSEKNYGLVYSFIESDDFKSTYDKYYDAFEEKSETGKLAKRNGESKPLSPKTAELLKNFKLELPKLFAEWKMKHKG